MHFTRIAVTAAMRPPLHGSKTGRAWHYITDKTAGVKGWVSDTYVYQNALTCLD